jgi:hypothetical protein
MKTRRLSPLLTAAIAALFFLGASGCGGSGSSVDQGLAKDADQISVYGTEAKLAKLSINGPVEEIFPQTQRLVSELQQARSDGVSSSWIDKQINSAEGTVESVNCHDCFSILEDAR